VKKFEYKYDASVDEDDKIVGKIWTRRQVVAMAGFAGLASLIVGCGGGGGGGGSSSSVSSPVITTQPSSASAVVGSSVSFSVVATGDSLTYQWYQGTVAISGATSSVYTIASVTSSYSGRVYHVVVTNSKGSVTSSTATLTVTTTSTAPSITTQPTSQTVAAGLSATFSVVASGSNLTYQWYRDSAAISGAMSASYVLNTATSSDSGASFYVVVSNTAGSATSNTVTLTVTSGIDLVATPQVTEGPFFVDENLLRSDLVSPGSSRSTVSGGFPLTLKFALYSLVGTTGTPLAGAHIDVWHADTHGTYSDEASGSIQSESTTGQTWLRGYQVTDSNGEVTFETIHPGWYTGRTPHIHVKIRTYNSSGNTTHTFTTQMFFTDAQNASILSESIYAHGTQTVFNANDNVYSVLQSDGTMVGSHLMLNASQGASSESASFSLAFVMS